MCNDKKAVIITTRGGEYSDGPTKEYEMGERYLRTILAFFGITDVQSIAAENLDVAGMDVDKILSEAISKATTWATSF